ncbi:MAG: hypothetical protein L0J18_09760, partial [Tetragenococcus koreensis]|nr:hypothetical protein [Tetragenococcus koreensis]
ATGYSERQVRRVKISIHALMKRATGMLLLQFAKGGYFNPRSHEESDRGKYAALYYFHFRKSPNKSEKASNFS